MSLLLRQADDTSFRFVSHRVSRAVCRQVGVVALSDVIVERFTPPDPSSATGPEPLPVGVGDALLELIDM